MKIKNILGIAFLMVFLIGFASAQEAETTVCCEKTISGLYCQDVPIEQCAAGAKQIPTSCSSTSFCKGGTCYDSDEGICLDNTPQKVCNDNGGIWSETNNPACNLGCCVLGDQAAFVSLVRCKRLSAFLGLQTNYKSDITDEVECVLSVQGQERGSCVYVSEFETTCRFTTRDDCKNGINGTQGDFYPGKLCSAEELKTNCGPTDNTICIPGKDEVYFVDSCGNPANIYDASKLKDTAYWTNVLDKSKVCNANSANANSKSCGNCNYQLGSICRKATETSPSYGDNICADLNCKNTQNGKSYKHGESWCIFNDAGETGKGKNSVGSRFFKHVCVNGEEVLEACADFRQEECIQDKITTSAGDFSQAACRVNRWQDCTAQTEQTDCENTDKRDCLWKKGVKLQQTATDNTTAVKAKGACLPMNAPGLTFWEGEETKGICAQANAQCIVTFEKGLTGGEKCTKNCECLEAGWTKQRNEVCNALGDCGGNTNWAGDLGSKKGFKVTVAGVKSAESSGGLFG
ncbi:MAG: hypothetical protein Q8L29_00100 [archaeon]|nr:hypothetical protein [archaeon]